MHSMEETKSELKSTKVSVSLGSEGDVVASLMVDGQKKYRHQPAPTKQHMAPCIQFTYYIHTQDHIIINTKK